MGDDQQKGNGGNKRKQPKGPNHRIFWVLGNPVLVDDEANMVDIAEYDWSVLGSSSSDIRGFVSSELGSTHAKKHIGIPVSPPKPFDPKQKGVVMSHELIPGEECGIKFQKEAGECSVPLCANCRNDQELIKFPCDHNICEHCLAGYFEENMAKHVVKVKCPDTKCRNELSSEWWIQKAAKAVKHDLCCPFYDCQARLMDDGRGFLIRACTWCWRLFCVKCRVSWHMGMTCDQFMAHAAAAAAAAADMWDRKCRNKLSSEWWIEKAARAVEHDLYCPFHDCQAKLMDDGRGFLIRACTQCWRLFCVKCRVSWHMGLRCDQFMAYAAAADMFDFIEF